MYSVRVSHLQEGDGGLGDVEEMRHGVYPSQSHIAWRTNAPVSFHQLKIIHLDNNGTARMMLAPAMKQFVTCTSNGHLISTFE